MGLEVASIRKKHALLVDFGADPGPGISFFGDTRNGMDPIVALRFDGEIQHFWRVFLCPHRAARLTRHRRLDRPFMGRNSGLSRLV